jgi:glutathione peroxidase
MRSGLVWTIACLGCGAVLAQNGGQPQKPGGDSAERKPTASGAAAAQTAVGPLDFVMQDIDGKDVDLAKYKGSAVLIVNVASECGLTPQYEQLQTLHEKYAARGLRILAFPSNDFGNQEPGTNEQIKEFCQTRFGVTFDLFSKVTVKGEKACELYKFLTSPEKNGRNAGEIRWNFTKFLVDRQGRVIRRFEPKVKPDAPEVIEAVEAALKAGA